MAIHASMTPNVALPGGKLTIQFDGTDDVTDVDVRVFEVDDQSQLEPVGKNKLVSRAPSMPCVLPSRNS
jgi:hypothetical protein